jgi:lipopolysaccharide/colanic/teichoic acid biosynthesis glycosyltransferase
MTESRVKEAKVNIGIYRRFLKRPMDFILSLMAIIVLSSVLIVVGVLVRVKLGSPVLFKQKRPGRNRSWKYSAT